VSRVDAEVGDLDIRKLTMSRAGSTRRSTSAETMKVSSSPLTAFIGSLHEIRHGGQKRLLEPRLHGGRRAGDLPSDALVIPAA